jgi:hypothetical protein
MHATSRQGRPADPGMPIRGTFYPSDGPRGGSAIGSMLAKLLAVVVALVVVRNVIGARRQHGGSSRWTRRRETIAEFHRELHAEDSAAQAEGSTDPGGETAKRTRDP